MSTTRGIAGTAALAALTAWVGRGVARRRTRIAAVAPELRQAALWVPLAVGPRTLPLARRAFTAIPDDPTATRRSRTVPGQDGRPDVTVWVHEPSSRSTPSAAVLWIHGGGLVMGSPVADHRTCAALAEDLDALVVSVTYRLAPEHPAPAAVEDCYTALRWMHTSADELGVDPGRIAVAGQSAGGGLAAALSQLALDRGGAPIAFQALIYPMLDDRTVHDDSPGTGHFVWSRPSNRFGWSSYLGHAAGTGTPVPYAVPARREDLIGLPPAWVGVGELDLFHDEDVRYAHRLRADGVPCELHTVPGMYHGADVVKAGAASMRAFRSSWVDALRSHLAAP